MFLYSFGFFVVSGIMLVFIPNYANTCVKLNDIREGWFDEDGNPFKCTLVDDLYEEKPFFPYVSTSVVLYIALLIQGFGIGNMLNTASSLISEMIGEDDENSAIVYATFNILESLSVGGVQEGVLGSGITDDVIPLKVLMGIIPVFTAVGAFLISRWKFKKKHDAMLGLPD